MIGTWEQTDNIALDNCCSHIGPHPDLPEKEKGNINTLELWPVLVGLKRWCEYFRGRSIKLYVDNMQVKYMIINNVSSNAMCMQWLRDLFWLCISYNIHLNPVYITSEDNFVADALSRVSGSKPIDVRRLQTETKNWCCSDSLLSFFDRWSPDSAKEATTHLDIDQANNKEV